MRRFRTLIMVVMTVLNVFLVLLKEALNNCLMSSKAHFAMIPAALKKELSSKVDAEVISEKSVSGGSINQAARIELSSGNSCFLKWNRTADPEMFNKEQKGLETLSRAQTDLCIPEVYATGATAEGTGYLVQEYMSEGHLQPHSATDFGRDLAQLH